MRFGKLAGLLLAGTLSLASPRLTRAEVVRGTPIRVAPIYLSPDTTSAKIADADRGREIIILDTSNNGTWLHIEANLTEQRTVTGWMQNRGIIQPSTADG